MAVLAFRSWNCDHGVCALGGVCAGIGECRLVCSGRLCGKVRFQLCSVNLFYFFFECTGESAFRCGAELGMRRGVTL